MLKSNGSSCPNNSAPIKPPRRKKRVSAETETPNTQIEVKPAPTLKKKLSWTVANIEETITCDEVVVKVIYKYLKIFF